jgi:putative hemolysin
LFGLTGVETIARDTESADARKPVLERVLDAMRLTPRVAAIDFERIPLQGPTLLCSNHPLGGADSTALLALTLRRRSDVKILTNSVMARFPFLAPHCIFVDPFGGADAARRNAAALRDALRWMKDGHLLIAHPAGEVSAMQWGQRACSDRACVVRRHEQSTLSRRGSDSSAIANCAASQRIRGSLWQRD